VNGTGQLLKPGKKRFLLPALLLVALLPLASAIANMVAIFYDALQSIGQGGAVLGLGLGLASLVVFMFGIFYVITVFYFAQDVEHCCRSP
jgi:ABC-2 type transport system permease protein